MSISNGDVVVSEFGDRIHVGIRKPKTPNEHEMPVNEMRAAIRLAGHRDSNLVRQCIYRAEREGLNGEDTMTLIAYFALRMYDDSFMREMDRAMHSAHPLMVAVPQNAGVVPL